MAGSGSCPVNVILDEKSPNDLIPRYQEGFEDTQFTPNAGVVSYEPNEQIDVVSSTENEEENETKDTKTTLSEIAKSMLKNSSIYAVSQIGHSQSNFRKTFWILVLLMGIAGCGYQIQSFLNLYFQYPIIVNLVEERNMTLEFPAVTVCNLNPVKMEYKKCVDERLAFEECFENEHLIWDEECAKMKEDPVNACSKNHRTGAFDDYLLCSTFNLTHSKCLNFSSTNIERYQIYERCLINNLTRDDCLFEDSWRENEFTNLENCLGRGSPKNECLPNADQNKYLYERYFKFQSCIARNSTPINCDSYAFNTCEQKIKYQKCMNRALTIDDCKLYGFFSLDQYNDFENCLQSILRKKDCWVAYDSITVPYPDNDILLSCSSGQNGELDKKKQVEVEFYRNFSQLDVNYRKKISFQASDLIKGCIFNGELCPLKQFTQFHDLRYGNCFTFNMRNKKSPKPLFTSWSGYYSGLELFLDIDSNQYLKMAKRKGARVIIHDPLEVPDPNEKGSNISPGFETSVSLRMEKIKRLPSPFKDHCADYGIGSRSQQSGKDSCLRMCIHDLNLAKCNCSDATPMEVDDERLCDAMDPTDICCLESVLTSASLNDLTCDCPLPCSSTKYNELLSTALLNPDLTFIEWLAMNFTFNSLKGMPISHTKYVKRNLIRLKVYYSTLELSTFEQKPMFQESELFSHLGGEFGLWLGLSIVVVFELIEILYDLCKFGIYKVTSTKQ